MILDNLSSILIQPVIGQISDRTWIPNWGRRMPFVIIGIPLAAFFFGLIGSFRTTLWVVIVAICGFNISMAFYKSPVMSLVPDILPKEFRSQGAGVLNIVGSTASITGLIIVSSLLKIESPFAFWVSSLIMVVCLIILVLNVKEKKDIAIEKTQKEKIGLIVAFKDVFGSKNFPLIFMLLTIFFQTAGYGVIETFISRYATLMLDFPKETAGYILAFFIGFAVIAALPAGLIGKKIGSLNACFVGIAGFTISIIPIMIFSLLPDLTLLKNILTLNTFSGKFFGWQTPFFLLLVLALSFSYLLLTINAIVVIWNLSPERKTATYTSYFYIFMHLASIASPFLAGGLFDLFGLFYKRASSTTSGLRIMFVYVTVCFVITFILISLTKYFRAKELRKIKDTDEYYRQILKQKEYPLLQIPMALIGIGVRQEQALIDLQSEQKRERKKLQDEIKKLKQNKRKLKRRFFEEIDDLVKLQIEELKEYHKLLSELKKDQKEKFDSLKQEIFEEKLKKTIEKEQTDKK